MTLLDGEDALRESSLRVMCEHSSVYVAYCGKSDEMRPLRSHCSSFGGPFILLKGARRNLSRAYLAFLSSFPSAKGNRERSEEELHLTGEI